MTPLRTTGRCTVVVLVAVFAGCVAPEPTPRDPNTEDSSGEASTGPLPPVGNQTMTLSDCEHLRHSLYLRDEVFRPQYPPGIRPRTFPTAGAMTLAGLDLWTCRQAIFGNEVTDGFQLFTFEGVVDRVSSPNKNVSFELFLFQAFTNSRGLVDEAGRLGLSIGYVEQVPVRKERVPTNVPWPSFSYGFAVPNGSRADYKVDGHLWDIQQGTTKARDAYYFADPSGALGQFRIAYEGKGGASSGGVVTFGPDSYWGRHADAEAWDFVNVADWNVAGELRFSPTP